MRKPFKPELFVLAPVAVALAAAVALALAHLEPRGSPQPLALITDAAAAPTAPTARPQSPSGLNGDDDAQDVCRSVAAC